VPSIEENLRSWNVDFDWSHEDWAKSWGSAADMWYGFVYPRIWRFLPAPTILEIAPGFGRWTEFLLDHCDTLIGIDIADKCIDACRQRFADRPGAIFETNDGHSLPMVADSSVDFAFSLDSLVHVEADPLKGYLTELARVLKPDGVAFLHHSNYGAYFTHALPLQGAFNYLPWAVRLRLNQIGIPLGNPGWRAQSVSAARFNELCEKAGMRCLGQELVNWAGGVLLEDSISVVTRPGSRWDRPNRVVKNRRFGLAARPIRRSALVYDLSAQPSA
jgi:SAM-dependent methyltransferase